MAIAHASAVDQQSYAHITTEGMEEICEQLLGDILSLKAESVCLEMRYKSELPKSNATSYYSRWLYLTHHLAFEVQIDLSKQMEQYIGRARVEVENRGSLLNVYESLVRQTHRCHSSRLRIIDVE